MDGKKFDKNTLKTLVIAASLLLNCVLGGASYTYYHHLAEQMNETASLQSQVSHLEDSVSDLQAQADESQPTIDDLKAQVASLTEEKNGLQTQVDTLTSQKADLQKQVDTLQAGASSGSSSGGSSSDSSSVPAAYSSSDDQSETVYVTDTGSKYHSAGCRYLKKRFQCRFPKPSGRVTPPARSAADNMKKKLRFCLSFFCLPVKTVCPYSAAACEPYVRSRAWYHPRRT